MMKKVFNNLFHVMVSIFVIGIMAVAWAALYYGLFAYACKLAIIGGGVILFHTLQIKSERK
jgi:hypothetical protein